MALLPSGTKHFPAVGSLRVNFSWMFVGRVVYSGCQWGILVLLAKLTSPKVVGELGLSLAITAPVFTFLSLNLRSVLASDVRDEHHLGDYVGLRLVANVLALLVVLIVTWAGRYDSITVIIILTIGLAKAVENTSDILYAVNQKYERLDYIAQSLMIKGPLFLAAVAVTSYGARSLLPIAIAMVLIWIIVLLSWDLPRALRLVPSMKTLMPNFNIRILAAISWRVLPLGLVSMIISLQTNIPRYFIESAHGKEALGYFTALAYILVAGDAVITSLKHSALPRLAQYFQDNIHQFTKLLFKLFIVAIGIGFTAVIFAWLYGGEFLRLVYNDDYARYTRVFFWLMVAGTPIYMAAFVEAALVVMRFFRLWAAITAVGCVVCLLSTWILVKPYGILGGGLAILAASLVNAGLGVTAIFWRVSLKRREMTGAYGGLSSE